MAIEDNSAPPLPSNSSKRTKDKSCNFYMRVSRNSANKIWKSKRKLSQLIEIAIFSLTIPEQRNITASSIFNKESIRL